MKNQRLFFFIKIITIQFSFVLKQVVLNFKPNAFLYTKILYFFYYLHKYFLYILLIFLYTYIFFYIFFINFYVTKIIFVLAI